MSCRVLIALTLLGAGPGFAEPATENIDFHDTYEASKGEKELATEQYEQAYGTYSKLAAETSDSGLATVAGARAAVALHGSLILLFKMVWPGGLGPLYAPPAEVAWATNANVVIGAVAGVVVTVVLLLLRRRQ